MNDREYKQLETLIQNALGTAGDEVLGLLLLDYIVMPKEVLYPALAELLGVDCECRTLECRGCEAVEEWLAGLSPEEEQE